MKKLNPLKTLLITGVIFLLIGCDNGSESNSITTVPITQVNLSDHIRNNINENSSSVLTKLLQLHEDLDEEYSRLDMELNIGTVVGNHENIDAKQGGDIVIHKNHRNGEKSYSYFTSGGNHLNDVKENYWSYNLDDRLVWKGVFEGPTGTLVVVVDGVYESGDGNDPFDAMSGSVWFRPWPIVENTGINPNKCYIKDGRLDCKNPAGPLRRCWDISLGPYDCRFTVSEDSQMVTAIGNKESSQPYTKVAEFINLSREKTFKETY